MRITSLLGLMAGYGLALPNSAKSATRVIDHSSRSMTQSPVGSSKVSTIHTNPIIHYPMDRHFKAHIGSHYCAKRGGINPQATLCDVIGKLIGLGSTAIGFKDLIDPEASLEEKTRIVNQQRAIINANAERRFWYENEVRKWEAKYGYAEQVLPDGRVAKWSPQCLKCGAYAGEGGVKLDVLTLIVLNCVPNC